MFGESRRNIKIKLNKSDIRRKLKYIVKGMIAIKQLSTATAKLLSYGAVISYFSSVFVVFM